MAGLGDVQQHDEQIRMVRCALAKLRSLKPFRGQELLVRDTEAQLAALEAARQNSAVRGGGASRFSKR